MHAPQLLLRGRRAHWHDDKKARLNSIQHEGFAPSCTLTPEVLYVQHVRTYIPHTLYCIARLRKPGPLLRTELRADSEALEPRLEAPIIQFMIGFLDHTRTGAAYHRNEAIPRL